VNPEQWERINRIYHGAMECEKGRREAYLQQACAGDAELRSEVERLIGLSEEAGGFLESPAFEVAAKGLAQGDSGERDAESEAGRKSESGNEDFFKMNPGLDFEQPDRIGPYKIMEALGEGGMGVVYLAEQTEPIRRRVALKVIKLGMDTREVIARFESERQALAMMNHPNIARAIDAGVTERGLPYFVMEYVAGIQLGEYCDKNRLNTRERLELFMPVCQAIQHAHQKGIIHRDIKPSNVLVTVLDGKPVPKVIDFGVAKATNQRLTEKTVYTQQGFLIGTPEYMSPEQAEMTGLEVDTTTDIYSLGVMLYELLVGALPFDSKALRNAGYDEIRRIIREQEPPRPTVRLQSLGDTAKEVAGRRHTDVDSLSRQLRGDLDWVTMKAMEKDRTRRYQSASELEADIQRHLNDEAVTASPPSRAYRLKKFISKYRIAVTATAAVIVALILGLIASTILYFRSENQRMLAERERQANRHSFYAAQMNLAQKEWDNANIGRLQELLQAQLPQQGQEDMRGFEWYLLWPLCHQYLFAIPFPEATISGRFTNASFSPDGNLIASASNEGTINFWDSTDGHEVLSFRAHTAGIRSMSFAKDNRLLATASMDGTAILWDVKSGRTINKITWGNAFKEKNFGAYTMTVSPDGTKLAIGGPPSGEESLTIRIWDLVTGEQLADNSIPEKARFILSLAFTMDGTVLAAATFDDTYLFEMKRGKPLIYPKALGAHGQLTSISPDGKKMAQELEGKVKIWDVAAKKELVTLIGHKYYNVKY
jgi:eukaryotic-like serine/threonine-protein kinase